MDAISNGADFLVIGRPIRDAEDPVYVVQKNNKRNKIRWLKPFLDLFLFDH